MRAFTSPELQRMEVGPILCAGADPATATSLTGHSVVVMLRFYRQVTEVDRAVVWAAVAKAAYTCDQDWNYIGNNGMA